MRRVLVTVFLVGALVCGVLAVRASDRAAKAGGSPGAVTTAAWSPRRVPQPFVDVVGATHLQQELDFVYGSTDGCYEVLTAAGVVASHQDAVGYMGASTQKLLTGAAALAVLGPDTTLTTRVVATGDPAAGTADKLVLVGGGDPLLATDDFHAALESVPTTAGTPSTSMEALADAVVAKGVKKVDALVVNDDRFDDVRYNPVWPPNYRTEGQIGAIGALVVNRGVSRLKPTPVPVDDPAIAAGNTFAGLLRARGVTVNGTVQRAKVPDGATEVATVQSAPMHDVVAEMVRSSDNLAAEMLVKEMGVHDTKEGTTTAGLAAAVKKLAELGVPMDGVALVDGSGLARENRVTCRALAGAIDLGSRPELAALWSGMPIAGQTGTLADEFLGTGLEGKLRGKTGFINGVTGLAGLVDTGRPVRFALIVNGNFGETDAVKIRGRLGQIIAGFPQSPTADALVPAPLPATPPAAASTSPSTTSPAP